LRKNKLEEEKCFNRDWTLTKVVVPVQQHWLIILFFKFQRKLAVLCFAAGKSDLKTYFEVS
jgi:hypothetical protein